MARDVLSSMIPHLRKPTCPPRPKTLTGQRVTLRIPDPGKLARDFLPTDPKPLA